MLLTIQKKLNEWLGIDISKRVPLGMMALVCDIDPSLHTFNSAIIKRKLPIDTVKWWKHFQDSVRAKAQTITTEKEAFYIPINFKLAIIKDPKKADIVLGAGQDGRKAMVLEVPRNPDATHPNRQKEVVQFVNQQLSGKKKITSYDVLCVRRVFKIDESKPNFYYKSKFTSPQYSNAFVDWIGYCQDFSVNSLKGFILKGFHCL